MLHLQLLAAMLEVPLATEQRRIRVEIAISELVIHFRFTGFRQGISAIERVKVVQGA